MQHLCVFISLATLYMLTAATLARAQVDESFRVNDFTSHDEWIRSIYGATPLIEAVSDDSHPNTRCLRIHSDQPSDTALGQVINIKPNKWYRFSGRVKTENLQPVDASVTGTYQIQNPEGDSIIASGPNHSGNTNWTDINILFRAPRDGRVRVCLFFAGFGKGVGTAYFNNLSLREIKLTMKPIIVKRDFLKNATINPMQYGQFIEYLCNLVPGMWAERLYDGNFEGLTPYNFEYIRQTDNKEKPWYPSGATNRGEFTLDKETKIGGNVSQKIEAVGGTPCMIGVSQDGVFVEKSKGCKFSGWMKGMGLQGPVKISIHREGKLYAATEFTPTSEWTKYTAHLMPSATDTNSTFTVEYKGPGTLWLDSFSLMPDNNVDGWRPEVVKALRDLKPRMVRTGGSVVDWSNYGDYDWKKTIGDPDRRMPFRSWGGLQPVGPGMEEIVHLIRLAGAEPLICMRFNNSTPAEAVEMVEYFNGSIDTPMGALRAKNGHPAPWNIIYWQVGNEVMSEDYDNRVASFCKALKEAFPNIKICTSYPTPKVVSSSAQWIDYVSPHHYGCDNLPAMLANVDEMRKLLSENAPGRDIKLAITEWNTTAGDMGPHRAKLWTLDNALACSRYHNLMHRECDIMEIANRSNLTNSFCSGIIQTDNYRLYKTPTYYAQELYATLAGNRPLVLDSETPSIAGPDISATLSKDGKCVVLFAINDSTEPIERTLDFSAYGKKGTEVQVWTLADRDNAGEPDAINSFGDPERVIPVKSKIKTLNSNLSYKFPALSLTVLRWKVTK